MLPPIYSVCQSAPFPSKNFSVTSLYNTPIVMCVVVSFVSVLFPFFCCVSVPGYRVLLAVFNHIAS